MDPVVHSLMLVEAVNSVALGHRDGCDCLACRAADGDVDAMLEIRVAVDEHREREDA